MVLDEAGMTAFQVTARVWFEQALYASIEKDEFLDYQTIAATGPKRVTESTETPSLGSQKWKPNGP